VAHDPGKRSTDSRRPDRKKKRRAWREKKRERERYGVPSLVGAGAGACAAAAAGMKMATTRAATATAPSGALTPAILPRESLPLSPAPEEERRGWTDGTATTPRAPAPNTNARGLPLSLSLFLSPRSSKKPPRRGCASDPM